MMMMKKKTHDNTSVKNKRFLITVNVLGSSGPLRFVVNVLGSSGPLRFVVNDDDKVSEVINSSLKLYARGGRLPVLGSDFNQFLLYPSNAESEAMKADEAVGVHGERTFVLCKKQTHPHMTEPRSQMMTRTRGWKAWFKILSLTSI